MFSIWTSSLRNKTRGITIIEVLTAMVVAMIGVFGVMALIPFAVKQAETGLDLDDAFRVARNGIAQFEISGHNRLINNLAPWSFNTDGEQVGTPSSAYPTPDVFSIDPMSIFGNPLPLNGTDPFGQFPPSTSIGGYAFPYIQEVNVGTFTAAPTPTYTPMNATAARSMFVSSDDLVFGDAADEIGPPLPYFDQFYDSVNTSSRIAARQVNGEMSWSAIVVPEKDDYFSEQPNGIDGSGGWKFNMHVLVYKNRVTLHTPLGGVGTMVMPVAQVVGPLAPSGFTSVALNAPPYSEIVVGSGTTITLDKAIGNVQKNDWLMLINDDPDLELGFRKQLAFYRVIGTGINPLNTDQGTITIDGPEFSFRRETDMNQPILTYAVLLVNFDPTLTQRLGRVVNVYERTFEMEQESNWTK